LRKKNLLISKRIAKKTAEKKPAKKNLSPKARSGSNNGKKDKRVVSKP